MRRVRIIIGKSKYLLKYLKYFRNISILSIKIRAVIIMKLRIEESFFETFLESRLGEEKAVFGTAILGTTSARAYTVKKLLSFQKFWDES